MGSVVSIIRVRNPEKPREAVSDALGLIDVKLHNPINSVVIKPNMCYYWDATTGYTTDPYVVGGIIDWVREQCGKDVNIKIVEADASAMRTKHAFPLLGYNKLANEKSVELVNLSNDELIDERVKVNGRELSFQVPQLLLKSDLFINVPKLKIMRATKITCAMKNIFGCIGYRRKIKYHSFLNEAIVGINKILRPHLNIVDGIVALGRFPVKLGILMAGVDPFSVDWTAARTMGYNPSKIKFLKIAMKERLGTVNGITTSGAPPEEFARGFPRENFNYSNYWWNIQFWLLKAYHKLSGDVIPPVIEEA